MIDKPTQFEPHLFNSSSAIADAKKKGFTVILPQSNQIQIDIDSEEGFATYEKNLVFLRNYLEVVEVSKAQSKSGVPHRKHIVLELKRDLTSMERVVLQLVLGSDLQREFYSYIRILNKDPYPTLFFEKFAVPEMAQVSSARADDYHVEK